MSDPLIFKGATSKARLIFKLIHSQLLPKRETFFSLSLSLLSNSKADLVSKF